MLQALLFVTSMVMPSPAWAAIDNSPLPADVPRVRRRFDPLYVQEGFVLGQRSSYGAEHPIGFDTSFPGALQLGNGLNIDSQLNDTRCEVYYREMIEAESRSSSPDRAKIEEITREMNDKCILDSGKWNFNILDTTLADRYDKLATQAKNALVVVYFKRAISRLAGSFETGQPRVWTSETTNYVLKFWNTNREIYKPPRFFSKFTGETDLTGIDSFGDWMRRFVTQNQTKHAVGFVARASVDNIFLKTYEVVVQTTERSGELLQMSVDDRRVFDMIVLGMLSGRPLKINYIGLRSLFSGFGGIIGYNSDLRVISVESLESTPNY